VNEDGDVIELAMFAEVQPVTVEQAFKQKH